MCDSKGVIYKGRKNVDQFKSAFAIDTKLRTLEEAMTGMDVFLGLSAKTLFPKKWLSQWRITQLYLLVRILILK